MWLRIMFRPLKFSGVLNINALNAATVIGKS